MAQDRTMGHATRDLERRLEKLRARAESGRTFHVALADLELTAVPAWVFGHDLMTLELGGNRLTTLPDELQLLERLELLDLRRNQLATLPHVVGSLRSLQELYLDHNQLTRLPSWLGELPALRYVQVVACPIASSEHDAFQTRWPALTVER